MVYIGTRIWQDEDTKIEYTAKIAFMMEDVTEVEEYVHDRTWKNNKEKIYVVANNESHLILENFNYFVSKWQKSKSVNIFQN